MRGRTGELRITCDGCDEAPQWTRTSMKGAVRGARERMQVNWPSTPQLPAQFILHDINNHNYPTETNHEEHPQGDFCKLEDLNPATHDVSMLELF